VPGILALALAVGLSTAGCVTLPNSTTPQTIGTFNRQPGNQARTGPQSGLAPDQLLQGFLDAGREPDGLHAQARLYLTRDASKHWNDGESTTIVDDTVVQQESRTDTHATYLVRATRVGDLLQDGVFQPNNNLPFQARISLSKFGPDWRIDQLPAGVILRRDLLEHAYRQETVYFSNPSGTALVPDLRWLSDDQNDLAKQLLATLLAGPAAALEAAVKNEFAGGISINQLGRADGGPGVVGFGQGGLRIDFHGAGALTERDRDLLAAQVYWTMSGAGIGGPYQLLADGKPLDDRFPNDWPASAVAAVNPTTVAGGPVGLKALIGGNLVSVGDSGVQAVSGQLGRSGDLRTASLSYDQSAVAAVAATARSGAQSMQLLVGKYGDPAASHVVDGTTISRPTWSSDNVSVWAVIDGRRVVRAVRDAATGVVSATDVDASQVVSLGKQLTDLRLSPDGVRAATILDGRVYVAVVQVAQDGRYMLVNPQPVPIRPGAEALSLAWDSGGWLVVAQDTGIPLVKVPVDGSDVSGFRVTQNLTPPVATIDVTPGMNVVRDDRTVLRLRTTDPGRDDFWREVPALIGTGAVPVLPG
jgi:hypothetical protein